MRSTTGPIRILHLALAGFAALLVLGCQAATPSAETSDVVDRVPFVDGEQLTYELVNQQDELQAIGVLSVRIEGSRFVLEQQYQSSVEGDSEPSTDTVTVAVDAATLRPFGGLREASRVMNDGSRRHEVYDWVYTVDTGVANLAYSSSIDGDNQEGDVELRDHYYDNETALWLWRTLPFSEEFEATYNSVNPMDGRQNPVRIQTPSKETIEVPAGTFETWRLIVRNGRALRSAWVNVEAPHEVVQWDNGDVIYRLKKREIVSTN